MAENSRLTKSLHRSRTGNRRLYSAFLIVSANAELLAAPATPNPNNAAIAVIFNAFC